MVSYLSTLLKTFTMTTLLFILLIFASLNEQIYSKTWISFEEYFKNSDYMVDGLQKANIVRVPCKYGYAQAGKKCRPIFRGVRISFQ